MISPILVGREQELEALIEAARTPPALVLLEGEAGVGKTRLVRELLGSPALGDRHRYVGACQQLSEPFPLGAVVEALRRAAVAPAALTPVAGVLRTLLPELSAHLPDAPEPLAGQRAERHRLFRALHELLGALGDTILVLEDLNWADNATLELLRFLAPQLPPSLSLVCTYRREEVPESSPLPGLLSHVSSETTRLNVKLRSLDRGEVSELAREILGADEVSDEFADYLLAGSGGLPFAVEELLQLLTERQDLVRRSGLWVRRSLEDLGVPTAVRDSILERLGRLGPEARRLVQAAAVLGVPCDEETLTEVAGLTAPGTDEALAEALAAALLLEEDDRTYAFRHVLARQAVEEAIALPVRRRLHLHAARALERVEPRPVARLAHHYRAAGETSRWIHYAEEAADRAKSLADDATAYEYLKEAISVSELPAPVLGRLAVKLAVLARSCLANTEAIGILRGLLADGAVEGEVRGEIRLWLARLLLQEGETTAVREETLRALADLGGRPELAAEAMVLLALPWLTDEPFADQLPWLDRAVEAAARSENRAVQLSVAGDRAVFLLYAGDPAAGEAILEIPSPGEDEDELRQAARGCGNLADALLHLGHYRRAEELIREGGRLLASIRQSHSTFAQSVSELQLDWAVGRWDGLEERARSYLEAWEEWESVRADAEAVLGLLLAARGEIKAALRLLAPLAEDFRGESPMLAWISGGLARIRLAEGRPEAALEETERVLALAERKQVWVWATEVAPIRVEALLRAGRASDAAEFTLRFARGLRGRDAPAATAALEVCRALLAEERGRMGPAAQRFLASQRAWDALPRPYEAARAYEGAGRCLLVEDGERGRELLVSATEAFRDLGARWDAARVRQTLREHGIVAPNRRGRKGYGSELSPREREVALMAGEGPTNREIAAALFVSEKTVERHLTRAMRKLGVSSRTQLAERLGRPGAVRGKQAAEI